MKTAVRPWPATEGLRSARGLFRGFTSPLRLVFWIILLQPLLSNCLHEFVELRDLLVCVTQKDVSNRMPERLTLPNAPLIFSILLLSIFASRHESPSICCAYNCHSERKPILIQCQTHADLVMHLIISTHDMYRIVDIAVSLKLRLDIQVSNHALFVRQLLSVGP